MTIELATAIVKYLKMAAWTARCTLEEEIAMRLIEDIVGDLDNLEIIAETIGYYNIVSMGLEGDLLELGKLPGWVKDQMDKYERLKMERSETSQPSSDRD